MANYLTLTPFYVFELLDVGGEGTGCFLGAQPPTLQVNAPQKFVLLRRNTMLVFRDAHVLFKVTLAATGSSNYGMGWVWQRRIPSCRLAAWLAMCRYLNLCCLFPRVLPPWVCKTSTVVSATIFTIFKANIQRKPQKAEGRATSNAYLATCKGRYRRFQQSAFWDRPLPTCKTSIVVSATRFTIFKANIQRNPQKTEGRPTSPPSAHPPYLHAWGMMDNTRSDCFPDNYECIPSPLSCNMNWCVQSNTGHASVLMASIETTTNSEIISVLGFIMFHNKFPPFPNN